MTQPVVETLQCLTRVDSRVSSKVWDHVTAKTFTASPSSLQLRRITKFGDS